MKLWVKIEAYLNKLIEKLLELIRGVIKKTTPKKIKEYAETSSKKIEDSKVKIKESVKSAPQTIKKYSETAKIKVDEAKAKAINKSSELTGKVKKFDRKTITFKKVLGLLALIFAPFYSKIKVWILTFQPSTILAIAITTTVASISSIGIYQNATKITKETRKEIYGEEVEIIEDATSYSKRPSYYKKDEKHFMIRNFQVPIHISTDSKIKSLIIDFSLISSNRYLKEYFFENFYLIKDRINSSVEPIVPSFPLEEEGKIIIINKLKQEINKLINESGAQGEIDEIYIHSIMAG